MPPGSWHPARGLAAWNHPRSLPLVAKGEFVCDDGPQRRGSEEAELIRVPSNPGEPFTPIPGEGPGCWGLMVSQPQAPVLLVRDPRSWRTSMFGGDERE